MVILRVGQAQKCHRRTGSGSTVHDVGQGIVLYPESEAGVRYRAFDNIQHAFQELTFSSKADPVEIRYSDVTSLGEGCGRLTDAPNVKSYIENLVTGVDGENTSEDEDQDRDDGIDDSD